jgi:hypothetical protein
VIKMEQDQTQTLEETTRKKENERLVFLGMNRIKDHDAQIKKPEGATLVVRKGSYAKFFKGRKPETNGNGWYPIPTESRWVCFPEYNPASEDYGKPKYKR